MSPLEQLVSPAVTRALGWTLLHSLWQGALLAAVLAGSLVLLRRHSAQVRYLVSAGTLAALVLLVAMTFGWYYRTASQSVLTTEMPVSAAGVVNLAPASVPVVSGTVAARSVAEQSGQSSVLVAQVPLVSAPTWLVTSLLYFDHHLPLLVLGWLLGLLAMSLRMLGGLLYVQRLRRYRVQPLGAAWQARLAVLAERGGLRRPVALLESALVQVPLVVGHVRPVILLPLGAVAGLPAAYLEAILAHELAHVLRRDYLVNLLQTVVEVLFFYHPAVWFMANCVRTERENCCDDTATELCGGDPLRLARALTALAEWSQSAMVTPAPRLALAAMGRQGCLLGRVRRLVQRQPAAPTPADGLLAGLLLLLGMGLLGGSVALAGPLAAPVVQRLNAVASGSRLNRLVLVSSSLADTTKRVATAPAAKSDITAIAAPTPDKAEDLNFTDEDAAELRKPDLPVSDDTQDPTPPRKLKRHRVVVRTGAAGHYQPSQPGTVILHKDKKGRLTDLIVNGQRIETPSGKPGKEKRKRKDAAQVEVIQLPGAPAENAWVWHGPDPAQLAEWKALGQLGQLGDLKQGEKMAKDFKFNFKMMPGPGQDFVFRSDAEHPGLRKIDVDRIRRDAARSATQGLAAARRGIQARLHTSSLSADERQALEKALTRLDRRSADLRPGQFRDDEHLDEAADRAEAQRERAEELRERRQDLQERIRETQKELRELEENGQETRSSSNELPVPPRPPRAPQAPRAPRAPRMPQAPVPPAPPAAPVPPVDNSGKVRDALRADGLIGKKDKSFQFTLNEEGMSVNGQRQPAATAEKYRQLLHLPQNSKGRQSSMSINFSESD